MGMIWNTAKADDGNHLAGEPEKLEQLVLTTGLL